MNPVWITIHDTANSSKGADALAHARYLKGDRAAALPVSWHYTIDDKHIMQHLPIDEIGWHAGDGRNGPGNRTSIGIEICENADGDRARAEANAAALVVVLLQQLGLGADRVVQHNRWTGKNCPRVLRSRPDGWKLFIAVIEERLQLVTPAPTMTASLATPVVMPPPETVTTTAPAKPDFSVVPDYAQAAARKLHHAGWLRELRGGEDFWRALVVADRAGLWDKAGA